MSRTQINAALAIAIVTALVGGLVWLLNVRWDFDVALWWWLLIWAVAVGGTFRALNEDDAFAHLADQAGHKAESSNDRSQS